MTITKSNLRLPNALALTIGFAAALTLAVAMSVTLGPADMVRKAMSIPSTATGVGGIVNGCNELLTPLIVVAGAGAPLGLVAGGILWGTGSRKGPAIMGAAIGMLLLVGSAKGIIA